MGESMRRYSFLEHYNYTEIDADCSCALCEEWRTKREVVERIGAHFTRIGWTKEKASARLAYFAVTNRRDLYCESSFHAAKNWWGTLFMGWLKDIAIEVDYADRCWWERDAPRLPLEWWFRQFDLAQVPSMSGIALVPPVDFAVPELEVA